MTPSDVIATKLCPKCGELKLVTQFHRKASRCDGLSRNCSKCECALKTASVNARKDHYNAVQRRRKARERGEKVGLDGDYRKKKHCRHGMHNTPEYNSWCGIIARCTNPKERNWHHYGGRGITVCETWQEDFRASYAALGPRPGPGYSVDRKNNNGHYEPGNCRWATRKQQQNNKETNRVITLNGESLTLTQWAEKQKINAGTIRSRLRSQWSVEDALFWPLVPRGQTRKSSLRNAV